MFTDFLDLNELHMVHSFRPEEAGVMIRTFGGYEEAERQIAAFLPDALSYDYGENEECFLSMYPIRCIRFGVSVSRLVPENSVRRLLIGIIWVP